MSLSHSLELVNAILCGESDCGHVIKDLGMGRLFCIIWMVSKLNHECPHKREAERFNYKRKRKRKR